jgi:hypothetical protein
VQYNDGFKTNLIGTPQQIAERIVELKNVGVDLILSGFYILLKKLNILVKKSAFGSRIRRLSRIKLLLNRLNTWFSENNNK